MRIFQLFIGKTLRGEYSKLRTLFSNIPQYASEYTVAYGHLKRKGKYESIHFSIKIYDDGVVKTVKPKKEPTYRVIDGKCVYIKTLEKL